MSNSNNTPKVGTNAGTQSNAKVQAPIAKPVIALPVTPRIAAQANTPPAPILPEVTPTIAAQKVETVADAQAEAHLKETALMSRFFQLDRLLQLKNSLRVLNENRDNLRIFKFGIDTELSGIASLSIKDSAGREFKTSKTVLIEEVVAFLETKLTTRIEEITTQALEFQL